MDSLIIDKPSAESLVELCDGTAAVRRRHSDILWSLILHDECFVPPFLSEQTQDQLQPLSKTGLLKWQPRSNWQSFQSSLNPVVSQAIELDAACVRRFDTKYDITVGDTPDHSNQYQVYGPAIGEITEAALQADNFLTNNLRGLEPLLLSLIHI